MKARGKHHLLTDDCPFDYTVPTGDTDRTEAIPAVPSVAPCGSVCTTAVSGQQTCYTGRTH
jgi:hypothetical protein